MDPFQYPDIPQIPAFEDDQHFFLSSDGDFEFSPYAKRPAVFGYYRDGFEQGMVDPEVVNMQPLQRFLHGGDPSPLPPALVHTEPSRDLQHQYYAPYGRPWPTSEFPHYFSRSGSPEGTSTSGTSSQAQHNDVSSPGAVHSVPYGTMDAFTQQTLACPGAESLKGGVYSSQLQLPGNSVHPKDLELQHHDEAHAPTEELEAMDVQSDYDYEAETSYPNAEAAQVDTISESFNNNQPDPEMGHSLQVAEEVLPMTQSEESDSDYKPTTRHRRTRSTSHRTPRRQTLARHGPHSSTTTSPSQPHSPYHNRSRRRPSQRDTKSPTSPAATTSGAPKERPFPCPLARYGCPSDFRSKNEWKRHVSTQHIKLGFWRCDLCAPTVDPHDASTTYHNDFNRKDLFTQHLRRMHAAPPTCGPAKRKEFPVTEDNIKDVQERCYLRLRDTPPRSNCLFCDKSFVGPASWEERMEHVGRHLEKERVGVEVGVGEWREDRGLEEWLVREGLIVWGEAGWGMGGGRPLRGDGEGEGV
ncbi:uncharacterized protein EI97DRAFT_440681 [Westerdykella ornata]|uniref:C2H2-type domain-containing protein n=1 Tax=Westerdykella ornata TaxID=318751 RepID=A0A6A6JNH4_WESOR|nr:uncharacterized protein EI97DRAFT_440681 [Westerdykella ornata]KAF2278171.1 hypothetical protein EI97DRAFT_440681 [Westerdykella ornata]